jgi:LuxR family transcriptional regulator, maltose regulon positive regulatory protein
MLSTAQRAANAGSSQLPISGDAGVVAGMGQGLKGKTGKSIGVPSSKFQPPHYRVRLLERRALRERLDQALSLRLTLLSTPAGYGKTTLLAGWWGSLEPYVRRVWVSLDGEDQEPSQFLIGLAASLSFAGLAVEPLSSDLRFGYLHVTPEVALRFILQAIEASRQETLIILDDYHHIESLENGTLLHMLVRNQPANLHLAIAMRSRPGFPVSQLRLEGQLLEITQNDLRFSEAEMRGLLDNELTPLEADVIQAKTEGWPAAVQLACLWLQQGRSVEDLLQSFLGSVDDVAAYLADQIFSGLPRRLRDFLIDTSILDRLNADLANATCDCDDAHEILADLDRLNALIFPMCLDRTWYRHHQLFAEFLSAQLQQQSRAHVERLHRRASAWYERHDRYVEAVQHLLKAGDVNLAVTLIERAGGARVPLDGGHAALKRLMQGIPPDIINQRLRLRAAKALMHLKEGDLKAGYRIFADVQEKYRQGDFVVAPEDRPYIERDLLLVDTCLIVYQDRQFGPETVAATEALIAVSNPEDVWFQGFLNNILCILHYRLGNFMSGHAAAQLGLSQYRAADGIYGAIFMHLQRSMFLLSRGSIGEAIALLTDAREMCASYSPIDQSLQALLAIFLAEARYERGEFEAAGELIFEALPAVEAAESWLEIFVSGYRTACELTFQRSGAEAAAKVLDRGEQIAFERGLPRLSASLLAQRLTLLLYARDTDGARALQAASGFSVIGGHLPDVNLVSWRERIDATLVLARMDLDEGDPKAALELLANAEVACLDAELIVRLVTVLILQSIAWLELGDSDRMAERMRQALFHSANEGLKRCFLVEGPRGEEQLKEFLSHVGVSGLTKAMLDWVAEILVQFEGTRQTRQRTLVATLFTDRERQILLELGREDSNKAIARRLDTSDNAIKFHLKNIFRKLGVNNRRLALSMAQKRGLIDAEDTQS